MAANLPSVLLDNTVQELPLALRTLDGEVTALDWHQHLGGGTKSVQSEQMQIGGTIQDPNVVVPSEGPQNPKQPNRFFAGQLIQRNALNFSQLTACRKNIKAILNRDRRSSHGISGGVSEPSSCANPCDSTVGNAKPRCTMGLRVQINQKNTLA